MFVGGVKSGIALRQVTLGEMARIKCLRKEELRRWMLSQGKLNYARKWGKFGKGVWQVLEKERTVGSWGREVQLAVERVKWTISLRQVVVTEVWRGLRNAREKENSLALGRGSASGHRKYKFDHTRRVGAGCGQESVARVGRCWRTGL